MKKIILPAILAIALTGAVSAQGYGFGPGQGQGQGRGPAAGAQLAMPAPAGAPVAAPALETISGKLELVNATPAIKTGTSTYYVRIPGRVYGFVEGLKEGAQVKVEGYKFALPNQKDVFTFHVEKLTIGDRTIDFAAMGCAGAGGHGMKGGRGMMSQGPAAAGAGAGYGRSGGRGGRGRY